MIHIQVLDSLSQDAITFVKEEWTQADVAHFGHVVDWKKEKMALEAKEDDVLLGVLELTIQAGVMYIDELIVKKESYGHGVGKMLMEKAETIAKEKKLHKIYLDTGAAWPATKFYEALGYKKTGDLPQHLGKQDYVVYSKYL